VVWGESHYALPKPSEPYAQVFSLVANGKADPRYPWDVAPVRLSASLLNLDTAKTETVELVPMGSGEATLRRMTFSLAP
jgi:hypothetical protein